MGEIAKRHTPISDNQLLQAIDAVYPIVFGREPTIEEKTMYLAHVALETSNYNGLYNFNVGNVSSSGETGNYWRPPWYDDPEHRHHERMLRGEVPSAFRAYSSLEAGVQDYLSVLRAKPTMVSAARAGDPYAFAEAIKATGYTPDIDPNAVGDSLARIGGFSQKKPLWPWGLALAGVGALVLSRRK